MFGVVLTGVSSAQTIQINRDNKTVAISTTDEATATADIAAITIGFEIYNPDAQTATADGEKLSHAILSALHKAGVEDKAIEGSGQGVERNKDFDEKEKPEQRGKEQFIFLQTWEVSVPPQLAAEAIVLP
ncbi:MAG TPA: SIMPL domain-containing protein [Terracidiphilus sp.]